MLAQLVLACSLSLGLSEPLLFSPSDVEPTPMDGLWESYKRMYGKSYSGEEEVRRRATWQHNVHSSASHNLHADMGDHSFSLGVNEYADLTPEEYRQYLTGYRRSQNRTAGHAFLAPSYASIPASWDWRKYGLVTPVKNQGFCGSCWAFSATGSLEGQHLRQAKKMVSLSEQNLVDCSGKWGNNGCEGGLMDNAFQYIKDNKGIDTEEAYPYTGKNGKCHYSADPADVGATDTGFVDIPAGDEEALKAAVATVGPVSVAIDAGHISFQLYRRGVYWSRFCSSENLDHGVLVVGYGTEPNGKDYWIVKNSWGESWGDKGYIKMARNMHNMCGIATAASYPLV